MLQAIYLPGIYFLQFSMTRHLFMKVNVTAANMPKIDDFIIIL